MATIAPAPAPSPSDLAQQILTHKAPHYNFAFSPFLRATYGHGLPPNRPICKAFVAGHCPLGAECADRHVGASAASAHSGNASYNSLVCKHWLRALCKKGEGCEFLHEYNLRKMPECNFFVRNGYCSNGDECLYLHIDPQSKLPPCPHYDKGFCPLGPNCSKKHVRRRLCPYYLAGFCPDGKTCKEGAHPRWEKNLEKPIPKSEVVHEEFVRREDGFGDDDQRDFGRGDRDQKGGRGDRFGGGRGGRWRGRGDRKFRGGRGYH
ncbi:RNA-binding component of cleavage and polyadenylation factor [Eutypa lata]|uniref:mRNA 3'-end-processing protein n=1 Tax=Eutypa lata (strain UCR-EL1) TaxID=1287681 RepID=M7SZW1_EUTLA|nr:putative zinc finger ccch type domain containing protein [Eutypa lata UCREL1]KAI1251530.1 RNA-binding component of cleavage and polyadenylation factor [Eutypa lata]